MRFLDPFSRERTAFDFAGLTDQVLQLGTVVTGDKAVRHRGYMSPRKRCVTASLRGQTRIAGPGSDPFVVIGNVCMRSMYAIFALDYGVIALAQSRFNATGSDITPVLWQAS